MEERTIRRVDINGIVTEKRTRVMRTELKMYEMYTLSEIWSDTRDGSIHEIDPENLYQMMRAVHTDKNLSLFLKMRQIDSNGNVIRTVHMSYPTSRSEA